MIYDPRSSIPLAMSSIHASLTKKKKKKDLTQHKMPVILPFFLPLLSLDLGYFILPYIYTSLRRFI